MVSKERLRSLNHLIEALTKLQRNFKSLPQASACQKDFSSFLVLHVSLTLFNLQGTHAASRLAGVLFIIALQALLVKNFFQVFSEFFCSFRLISVLLKPVRTLRRELI